MTYVNKKIRVFLDANEKDATQVRAEGQMKSYVSATDARVWCDFIEERRQQILEYQAKCRTGMCPGKLIPIEDLLHLIMGEKETELADLRKRVEFLEKLIEIYDNLPLTNEQKCKLDAGKKKLEAQYKEKACKSPCASGQDPNPPCDGSCALDDGQSTLCEEKSCSASCVGDAGAFFTPPESSVNVDKPSKPNGKPPPGDKPDKPSGGSGACPWVPTCKDTCRFPCKDGVKKGSTANGNDKKRGSVDKKSTDNKSIDKGVNAELGPCKDACIDTCTAPCKSAIKSGSKNKSSGGNGRGSRDMSVQRSSVTINDSCRCIEFKNKPNSNYVCKGPCSRH